MQIGCQSFEAHRVAVQGINGDVPVPLQQVAGFATGCAAGIENMVTGSGRDERGGQLCRFILHTDGTRLKTRQSVHRLRAVQGDGLWRNGRRYRRYAQIQQLLQVLARLALAFVNSQGHRWWLVIARQNGLIVLRPGTFDGVDQPLGMGVLADRAAPGQFVKFISTTPGIAQHAVDQPPRPGFAHGVGDLNGFTNRRVGRNAGKKELV